MGDNPGQQPPAVVVDIEPIHGKTTRISIPCKSTEEEKAIAERVIAAVNAIKSEYE
jgi:hypothetical protein